MMVPLPDGICSFPRKRILVLACVFLGDIFDSCSQSSLSVFFRVAICGLWFFCARGRDLLLTPGWGSFWRGPLHEEHAAVPPYVCAWIIKKCAFKKSAPIIDVTIEFFFLRQRHVAFQFSKMPC